MKEEIINVTIYDPSNSLFKSSKSERAECKKFLCSNKDNCDLYRENRCMNVANIFGGTCMYGRTITESGFTRRASKFHSWISERKKKYSGLLYKLNGKPNRIAVIGEYYFLPYAHMNLNERFPFESPSTFMSKGKPFIKKELFTIDLINDLALYQPRSMMGGQISSYQEKEVPKFIKDLQDTMPALYAKVVSKYPDIAKRIESYSYVGRKALIESIRPGVEIVSNAGFSAGRYLWDGTFLICKNYKPSFPLVEFDEVELKLKPKAGESIEVTDNNQVDGDTIFVD